MTRLELFQIFGVVFNFMMLISISIYNYNFKNNFENMTWGQNKILEYLIKLETYVLKKEKREVKKTDDYKMIECILANFLEESQKPRKITIKVELLDENMDAEIEVERTFDFKKNKERIKWHKKKEKPRTLECGTEFFPVQISYKDEWFKRVIKRY